MSGDRRRLVGRVASNKMTRTVVVVVERSKRHPLYGKVMRRARRYQAHDEMGCQVGDVVQVVESRPLSKNKRWVVEKVLSRGAGRVAEPAAEPQGA